MVAEKKQMLLASNTSKRLKLQKKNTQIVISELSHFTGKNSNQTPKIINANCYGNSDLAIG